MIKRKKSINIKAYWERFPVGGILVENERKPGDKEKEYYRHRKQ